MKTRLRLALVLGLGLLVPVQVFAQAAPESTVQMSLAGSPSFLARLQYLQTQQARTVKAEALATVCHAKRSVYADAVISDPAGAAKTAAVMVVGGANLIATVVPNSNSDKIDSSATDAAILSQVATFWSALAKCDTGA
jgi:hypothetical protein